MPSLLRHVYAKCGYALLLPRMAALFSSCHGSLCLLIVNVHGLILHQAAIA